MTVAISAGEFLRTLWGDQEGIAELAPFSNPKTKGSPKGPKPPPVSPFLYPSELDAFLERANSYNGKFNAYMGVCLRREKWPRKSGKLDKDGKEVVEYRGTSENTLSSMVVWTDIDFDGPAHKKKGADPEEVRKALKEFRPAPSIVVRSGNGIHVYWLLKEPATSDGPTLSGELLQVEAVNRKIAKRLGGDSTTDLARILRIPGTLNIKTDPPKICEISRFEPTLRYTLMDFDEIPEVEEKPEPVAPKKPATPEPVNVDTPAETGDVDVDALPVSGAVKQIILEGVPAYVEFRRQTDPPKKFAEREAAGKMSRSESDAFVVTSLLQGEVPEDRIYSIFRRHPAGCGEKYAEKKTHGDSYLDHTIASSRKLIQDQPKWTAARIASAVSTKTDRDHEDEKFKIVMVTKYRQEPPTYTITISLAGKEYATRCTIDQAYYYEAFKKAVFATHDVHLPGQRQTTWAKIYDAAQKETKEVEKEEGTVDGQIEAALDDLVGSAISEQGGISGVNHMAVKTDDGEVILKTPVLLRHLRSQGVEVKRNGVIHYLKEQGWKGKPHRFGQGVTWVWSKVYRNGKAAQPDLFPGTQETVPQEVES